MGDRTQITCLIGIKDLKSIFGENYIKAASDRFFFDEHKINNGYIEFLIDEANYGAPEVVEDLETLEIPFIWTWGQGQTYSAGSVASDSKTSYTVVLNEEDEPVIVTRKKNISTELKNLENYEKTVKDLKQQWNLQSLSAKT